MTDTDTAIRVETDPEVLYRVRSNRGPKERDLDEGILWLRDNYKSEHGNLVGWEVYAREAGIITPHRQEAIDSHESSLDEMLGWVPDND